MNSGEKLEKVKKKSSWEKVGKSGNSGEKWGKAAKILSGKKCGKLEKVDKSG